jgi:PAS domain S-box-containing protein
MRKSPNNVFFTHLIKLNFVWLPIAIFVFGIIVTLILSKQQSAENQQQIQAKLDTKLQQISSKVVESITLYQYGLKSLKGAVLAAGVEEFSHGKMRTFSEALDIETAFSGANGFGLIRNIAHQQQTDFIQSARLDRPDGIFDIQQLSVHLDNVFVIQYIEPEDKNQQAIGLDIGSESNRRQAAIESAKQNDTRLTAPITLVQANNKVRHGFLILMPIYRTKLVPEQPEDRINQVYAWSYAAILIDKVLNASNPISQDVLFNIRDNELINAEAFYQSGENNHQATEHSVKRSITLFGRVWNLELTAKQPFIDSLMLPSRYQIALMVMGMTLVLMLLVSIGQLIFARNKQATEHKKELAKATELALRHANSQLELEVSKKVKEMVQVSALQRSILENAGYAIIATDENGKITAFNPAAENLLGYDAEELIDIHTAATFHVIDEVVAMAKVLSAEFGYTVEPGFEVFVAKARSGKADINDWTYVHKDGKHIPVRLTISSLYDDEDTLLGFLGIAYDLTKQREHDRMLAETTEKAEQANQAKSLFLSNMSHEIRTPLNGIYGSLQVIKREVVSAQGRDLLDKALYSTQNLNVIINDILDFSKIEAGKLELENGVFKLSELMEHLRSDLSVLAATKKIKFDLSNTVEHQHWQGDPIRIRQILLNIGSNAIKFTEQGGVTFRVNYDAELQQLVFTMQDTGVGMEPEQQQRLFQRFEQADTTTTRKFGGTGLGLSITHSLVEMMDGTIKVESELGIGSTMIVRLPLAKAEAPIVNDVQQLEQDISFAGKTILIAEDNEINRVIVEAMLAPTKAILVFAINGIEAIEAQKSIAPDIILMDIQMPKMDGVEACSIIKQAYPDQVIIALTANAMSEDIKVYEETGFDGHLAKPIDLPILLGKLQQVLID